MDHCPDDTDLLKVIDDALPAPDLQAIDAHLTHCDACRRRLESLAGVDEASAVLRAERAAESTLLRTAIERLQGDSPRAPDLPQLEPTSRPGFIGRLGKIEIRRVIGRGGMGVVFEGLDVALDRPVAVKLLSSIREGRDRLLNEARAAAAVHHEYLVAIHAIEESLGRPFLILQYIRGESLADRLAREKKLSFDAVVRLGIQTANGLAAAHARGLVHRDIKPANILLEAGSDDVRIADFGLAKVAGADSVTQTGFIVGTPAFMSPEQAEDRPVDARTDLFSLGVVLYQASTGVLPFAAESPYVLLDQIRHSTPKPLRDVNPDLPEWFATIVERLLAKDPAERLSSASELASLLDQRAAPARRRRARSRRRYLFLAPALVVLIAVLFVAGALFISGSNFLPPISPRTGFVIGDQSFATLADAVRAAPDGAVIEIHGDGPYLTPTIKTDGKRLTIRAAPGFQPKFVPDAAEDKVPLQFLVSSTDLQLEGLEINWPARAQGYVPKEDGSLRSIVGTNHGRLVVSHCRIIGGEYAACVWAGGRETIIDHCHLISRTGAGVGWRPTSDASLHVEQNVFEGQGGIVIVWQSPGRVKTTMTLTNNTFITELASRLILEAPPSLSIRVAMSRNVIDTAVVISLVGFRGFPRSLASHLNMTETAQEIFTWTEKANVYRKGTTFLSGHRAGQPYVIVPSEIRTLREWLDLRKVADSQSIEGSFKYDRRPEAGPVPRVVGITADSGPISSDHGAAPDRVGPGR